MTRDDKIQRIRRFIDRLQQIVATADVDDDCKQALPRFHSCEQKLISFLADACLHQDASVISSHAQYVPATYGAPVIDTMKDDVEVYCGKLNAILEDLLDPIYTPEPKLRSVQPASPERLPINHAPITVTGSHNKVLVYSTDSSTTITVETVFHSVEESVKEGIADTATRDAILSSLAELRGSVEAKDARSAWQKYKAFVAVVADHFALLQPFLPQLTALLPT